MTASYHFALKIHRKAGKRRHYLRFRQKTDFFSCIFSSGHSVCEAIHAIYVRRARREIPHKAF